MQKSSFGKFENEYSHDFVSQLRFVLFKQVTIKNTNKNEGLEWYRINLSTNYKFGAGAAAVF